MIATATYSHNYLIVCTIYYCLLLYDVSERASRSGTGTKVTVSLAWLRKHGRFSLVCDCRLGLAWIHDMNHIGKIVKLALINELQRNLVLHGFGVLLGLVTAFSWTKEGSESQFSARRHGEDGRGTALCRAWLLRTMLGLLRRHALRYRLLCVVGGAAIYGSCLVLTTQSVLVVSGKFSSFWRNKRADWVYFTIYSIGF